MKISKSGQNDKKQHNVIIYNVLIDDVESEILFLKLFGDMVNIDKVTTTVKDNIFNTYLKTYVANEFLSKIEIERSIIYKLEIRGKEIEVDMMLSLHDKLDEIFY